MPLLVEAFLLCRCVSRIILAVRCRTILRHFRQPHYSVAQGEEPSLLVVTSADWLEWQGETSLVHEWRSTFNDVMTYSFWEGKMLRPPSPRVSGSTLLVLLTNIVTFFFQITIKFTKSTGILTTSLVKLPSLSRFFLHVMLYHPLPPGVSWVRSPRISKCLLFITYTAVGLWLVSITLSTW